MKHSTLAAQLGMASLMILSLPYLTAFAPGAPGNPDRDPLVGQAGSTYDIKANPPQTIGVVSYDPYTPLPPTVPPQLGTSGSASPQR